MKKKSLQKLMAKEIKRIKYNMENGLQIDGSQAAIR